MTRLLPTRTTADEDAGAWASPHSRNPARDEPDFVLRLRPGDFRRPSGNGSICPQIACCCCCCCLDVVGAWAGAWLGGMIGGGITYGLSRHRPPSVRSYGWVLLWNFLFTLALVGIFAALIAADAKETFLTLAIVLTGWTLLATPICCLVVGRRWSSKIVGASLCAAVLGAVAGFAIGAAIMGGSVILGDL